MDKLLACIVTARLFVFTAAALDGEMAELAKMIRDNCVDEIGVDVTLLEQVDAGADLMPDEKFKCYLKCTLETAGILSDGVVDVEYVLELIPEDLKTKNENLLRKCDTQKGSDDCDTAFLTQVCWQNGNKADYFLI